MKFYDVLIIGAGPAGLFAATQIKEKSVCILEKNNRAGKKLLISGAGRCNITNSGDLSHFLSKFDDKSNFVQPALKEFSNHDLLIFFNKRGLNFYLNKNGKYFPETDNGWDILNLLLDEIKYNREINYNSNVIELNYIEEFFIIKTQNNTYKSKYLILATGGLSYPTTGSTGDGYRFAIQIGHTVINTKPALVSIKIKDYIYKEIEGISLDNITITKIIDGKKITKKGDIIFTRNGLSGPCIIDFSRKFNDNDLVILNFTNQSFQELEKKLICETDLNGKQSIKNFLKITNCPERMILFILDYLKIDNLTQISKLNKSSRKVILNEFTQKEMVIEKVNGYNMAMVTAGGINTKEINRKTMESKIIPNLFFCGEVIDVDGDTGGYNIQFAFSSAFLAAKKINL